MIVYGLRHKCISVVVEPTQAQSRRLFKQISDMLSNTGIIKFANSQLLTMEFFNGSEILFKSAEQKEALRGFTVSGLLVIDEAAYIQDEIFEILYPTVDANNAPILVISTPLFCSGEFYSLYVKGNKEKGFYSYDWSKFDTSKYLSREKLEQYRQMLSPLKFRSEYLGEFISEGSYVFGDFMKCAVKTLSNSVPRYAAIDWGSGKDGDYTALIYMDDKGNVCKVHKFNNISPTEQIDTLASTLNNTPTLKSVVVEINSLGYVYYDMLKKKVKCSVKQFNTTNESKRRIIEQLITAFELKTITIPFDPELQNELQHYAMEKTKTGYTYNGTDGYNDDLVMTLAMVYDEYKKQSNVGNIEIDFVGY